MDADSGPACPLGTEGARSGRRGTGVDAGERRGGDFRPGWIVAIPTVWIELPQSGVVERRVDAADPVGAAVHSAIGYGDPGRRGDGRFADFVTSLPETHGRILLIIEVRSYARGNLLCLPGLSLASRDPAAGEQFQSPRSWLKKSRRK